jgi:DNA-binding HxlR family transcriptional regulator
MKSSEPVACPIARAANLIGDEWILLVVRELFKGPQRFDDLQKSTKAATNILSNRLNRMIDAGIVSKMPYQERPVRFNYRLTKAGIALFPALMALGRFAEDWLPCSQPSPFLLRHLECGKITRPGHSCSECGQPLTTRNVVMQTADSAAQ